MLGFVSTLTVCLKYPLPPRSSSVHSLPQRLWHVTQPTCFRTHSSCRSTTVILGTVSESKNLWTFQPPNPRLSVSVSSQAFSCLPAWGLRLSTANTDRQIYTHTDIVATNSPCRSENLIIHNRMLNRIWIAVYSDGSLFWKKCSEFLLKRGGD